MKYLILLVIILALSINFIACSSDTLSTTEPPNTLVTSPTGATPNQEPVEVISVSEAGQPNPGGPTIKITLKNTVNEAVVSLKVVLKLEGEKTFEYDFPDVSTSTPLQSGESTSQTLNLIGPTGYSDEAFYPLTIHVRLANGDTFNYTKQVQIS
jgi:hypothetical protein